MATRKLLILVACLLGSGPVAGQTAPQIEEPRGELLYSTHCIGCHTTQIHWRDKKLVSDWTSLKAQVRRWQRNTGLGWSEHDIIEVARRLNALYYHFPSTGEPELTQGKPPQQIARDE